MCAREQQVGAWGWFLERLEDVVGGLLGEPVCPGDDRDPVAPRIRGERQELLERGPGLLVAGPALRERPHAVDADVLRGRVLDPEVGMGGEPPWPGVRIEQLPGERECRGRLADPFRADQEQGMGELVVNPTRSQALEAGAVADDGVERGHRTDCAELPAVTQSQTPASAAAWPPHEVESGRHYAARVILYMEAAFLALIAFGFLTGGEGTGLFTQGGGGGLCVLGVVILAVGATRMRRDRPIVRDPTDENAKVPWDWTDFL